MQRILNHTEKDPIWMQILGFFMVWMIYILLAVFFPFLWIYVIHIDPWLIKHKNRNKAVNS